MSSIKLNDLLKIGSDVLTTVATTLSGAINELKTALDNKSSVSVTWRSSSSGSAAGSQTASVQAIVIDDVYYNISGTAFIEKTVTLDASNTTNVVFLEDDTIEIYIDRYTLVEFSSSKWNLVPDNIITDSTNGEVTVTLPADSDTPTVTVRIYVR